MNTWAFTPGGAATSQNSDSATEAASALGTRFPLAGMLPPACRPNYPTTRASTSRALVAV